MAPEELANLIRVLELEIELFPSPRMPDQFHSASFCAGYNSGVRRALVDTILRLGELRRKTTGRAA